MKKLAGIAVLFSSLVGCGSDPPPPAQSPESTSAASTGTADMPPPPSELPKEPPPAAVVNFGKKAPAAGVKLTDKVTIDSKDDKRVDERKIEILASEDKSITKEKVILASFEWTVKGKSSSPNKNLYTKVFTVEPGKDGATVTNEAGKPASAQEKFVYTRRGPHVGEPLAGILAFSERPLKSGDIVEGDAFGRFVSELVEWKDENVKTPATVKRDFTGSKATLKSIDNGIATFEVVAKEKTTDGAAYTYEAEYTGTILVKVEGSMAQKADLKGKLSLKIKDMPGPGGKKISLESTTEPTVTFERKWE